MDNETVTAINSPDRIKVPQTDRELTVIKLSLSSAEILDKLSYQVRVLSDEIGYNSYYA